jgi:hypothetical protein
MKTELEDAAVNCWAEGAWDNRDDFTDGFIEGAKSDVAKEYWFEKFQQDKNKFSELVDLLERLRPIYREDSDSYQKYEEKRLDIVEQFKKK